MPIYPTGILALWPFFAGDFPLLLVSRTSQMCRLLLFVALSLGLVSAAVEWQNSPVLTRMWESIAGGRLDGLLDIFAHTPDVANHRSEDGRGALFWAYEFKNTDALAVLLAVGVSPS